MKHDILSKHKSWRDLLPVHPAAELFPMVSDAELVELGEDIKKNGLTSPIAVWRDSPEAQVYLLDGRNRLDAIEMAISEPLCITDWHGVILIEDSTHVRFNTREVEGDPYAFVISANIRRRHLTSEQKRELIAKLIKATPEKSDRQIAETVKASPTTVGTVRAEMESKGDVSKLDTRTDSKGRQQPASKPKVKIGAAKVADPEASAVARKAAYAAEEQQLDNVCANADFAAATTTREQDVPFADAASELRFLVGGLMDDFPANQWPSLFVALHNALDELLSDRNAGRAKAAYAATTSAPLAGDDPSPIPAFLDRALNPPAQAEE